MTTARNGTLTCQQQPSSWGRNSSGQFYVYKFDGLSKEQVSAMAALYDAAGAEYEVTEGFGKHSLQVRISYNPSAATAEVAVDLWEYTGGRAEKDVLEADVPSGITATLSQNNIGVIRAAIQNPPDGSDTTGAFSAKDRPNAAVTAASFADGNPTNALTVYKLMQAGVKSALVRNPTLRHTQTVSQYWTVPASQTRVGRIISTASMTSLEFLPTGLLFNLPTLTPASFQTIAVAYGWLKHDPTIQQVAFKKWQLIQEYEFGLWATAIYGAVL